VLAWAWASRTPWREIGYARPSSWKREVLLGATLGIVSKLLMKAVVMPLLGADPINPRFHHLVGNPAAVAVTVPLLIVASAGEETLFRGFFFERLGKLFGGAVPAKAGIVVLTAALFGLAHEGAATMQQAALTGLVYGAIYAISRQLWMVTFAHIAFNLTAVAIIFYDLETTIAHLFFR
jgi:membrane protease YdiL (CAAX protease family)